MPRAYHLNLWIDPELQAALEHRAGKLGLTISAATRALLRDALSLTDDVDDAAWREAYAAATATVRKRVNQLLRDLADELAEGG